nr:hypothetical protein [Tanacetum cinerariifolium]
RIAAGEHRVHAAGAVDARVGGHVVDGAVEGEVDRQGRVFAVVMQQLRVCQEHGAALRRVSGRNLS